MRRQSISAVYANSWTPCTSRLRSTSELVSNVQCKAVARSASPTTSKVARRWRGERGKESPFQVFASPTRTSSHTEDEREAECTPPMAGGSGRGLEVKGLVGKLSCARDTSRDLEGGHVVAPGTAPQRGSLGCPGRATSPSDDGAGEASLVAKRTPPQDSPRGVTVA